MYVKKNSCQNGRILLTLTYGYRENWKSDRKTSRLSAISMTKKKIRVDQKQVVFYSRDYADQARYERGRPLPTQKSISSHRPVWTGLWPTVQPAILRDCI